MHDARKFWDNAAEKYQRSKITDVEAYEASLERVKYHLSSMDKVLEVGCGTGSTALLLAGEVSHIVASDLSKNMTGIGAKKALDQGITNVDFVTGALFDRKLASAGPYDVVLAFNLLHLLEDMPASIKRISELLKPGGLFISKTICMSGAGVPFYFGIIKSLLPLMQMLGKAPFVTFMETRELDDAMLSAGLTIIETGNYPASPPRYFIVGKKN